MQWGYSEGIMVWTNKMEDFKGDNNAQEELLRTSEETGKDGHVAISFAPNKEAKVYITSEVADDDGEMIHEDISFKTLRELAEQLRHAQVEKGATVMGADVLIVEKLADWEDAVQKRFIANGLPVTAEFYAEACHLLEVIQDKKIHAVLKTHIDEYVNNPESETVQDAVDAPKSVNRGIFGQNIKQEKVDIQNISITHVPKKEDFSEEKQSGATLEAVPYSADVSVYIESLIQVAEARGDDVVVSPDGGATMNGVDMAKFLKKKLDVFLEKIDDPHSIRRISEKDPTVDKELQGWFRVRIKNTPLPEEVKDAMFRACIETAHTRALTKTNTPDTVDTVKAVSLEKQGERDAHVKKPQEIPVENVSKSPRVLEVRQETVTHEESPAMSPELQREIDTELEKWLGDTQVSLQALKSFLEAYVQYVEAEKKTHGLGFLAGIFHQNAPHHKQDLERMGNELLVGADTFVRDTEARMRTMRETATKLPEHESEAYVMLTSLIETLRQTQNSVRTRMLEEHRTGEIDPRTDSATLAMIEYAQAHDIPESVIPKETMRLETNAEANARLGALHLETEHEAEVRTGVVVHGTHTIEVPKRETADLVEQLLQELDHNETIYKKEEVVKVSGEKKEVTPVSTEDDLNGSVRSELSEDLEEIETHNEKEFSGAEGVRAIFPEYKNAVGAKTGWEGITAFIEYLRTRNTVPSRTSGVVEVDKVVRAIELLTLAMPTEKDGAFRAEPLLSSESVMYKNFGTVLPRGGLREIVFALIEGKPVDLISWDTVSGDIEEEKSAPVSADDSPVHKEGAESADGTSEDAPVVKEEKKNESQDVQQELHKPESPPKAIAEEVCKEFAESFNITKETLEATHGFAELDPDRQRLVLHTLRESALLEVQSESVRGYRAEQASSGFVKKMWLGLTKVHQLNERKKAIAENIFDGHVDKTETLATITKMVAECPSVTMHEGGVFTVSHVGEKDFSQELTAEEKMAISRFNEVAETYATFSNALRVGATWERNEFDATARAYKEARQQVLSLKERCDGTEASLLLGNAVDRTVMMRQYLASCPEVEAELQKIRDESVLKQTIIQMLASRGGYFALGAGIRGLTASVLGFVAAPLAGAMVGGVRARGMAKETLREEELLSRTGGEWNTAEHHELHTAHLQSEARNITSVRNEAHKNGLIDKLEVLMEQVENESDSKKKEKLMTRLHARIEYTQQKVRANEVNFGHVPQRASEQLDLLQTIGRAQAFGEFPVDEKLEERLTHFLGVRSEAIDKRQRQFVNRRMWQGVRMGAGFAFAGALVGNAVREWVLSGNAVSIVPQGKDVNFGKNVPNGTPLQGSEVLVAEKQGDVSMEQVSAHAVPENQGDIDARGVSTRADDARAGSFQKVQFMSESNSPTTLVDGVPVPHLPEPPHEMNAPHALQEMLEKHVSGRNDVAESILTQEKGAVEAVSPEMPAPVSETPLALSYTYMAGDSPEKAIQNLLKTDPRVSAYQSELTPEELGSIATRVRMELEKDTSGAMREAFGIKNGNWNKVPEGFTVKTEISWDTIKEAIDRFHPPEVHGEEQVIPDVSNRIAELEAHIARLEAQPNVMAEASQEQLRVIESNLATIREEVEHVAFLAHARIEGVAEELQTKMEAVANKIETIAKDSLEKVGIVPLERVREDVLHGKLFSGVSTRLSHFSPTQVASSIGEIGELYKALDEIQPLDIRVRETLSGVFTENGLLKGYPKEHIDALRDMPDVWGVITLKDILDTTKGTTVLVGEKRIPLSETTETMLIDLVYRMRIQGGEMVDAIAQRVAREGGTMLDLIKQAYPVLPKVYPV